MGVFSITLLQEKIYKATLKNREVISVQNLNTTRPVLSARVSRKRDCLTKYFLSYIQGFLLIISFFLSFFSLMIFFLLPAAAKSACCLLAMLGHFAVPQVWLIKNLGRGSDAKIVHRYGKAKCFKQTNKLTNHWTGSLSRVS